MSDKDLCDQIADAIGPTMRMGFQGAKLPDGPNDPDIEEWITWIAGAARDVVAPEMDRLKAGFAKAVQRAGQAHADAERKISDVMDRVEAEMDQLRAGRAGTAPKARKRSQAATGYRLIRTTPEGDTKEGIQVRRVRDAATSAALVLTDNLNTPKAEAQRFAAVLHDTPVGDSVRHASGYVFRIEKVADAS